MGTSIALLFGFVFFWGLYFLPSILAILTKKDNVMAILALNILLGWTLIGWVVSLVWALSKETKQQ